jgi:hypothetical protein
MLKGALGPVILANTIASQGVVNATLLEGAVWVRLQVLPTVRVYAVFGSRPLKATGEVALVTTVRAVLPVGVYVTV